MQPRLCKGWGGKRCFLLLAAALLLSSTVPCGLSGEPGGPPPKSNAFGKPLSEWFALHWSRELWSWVGIETPDHLGHLKFLPIPAGDYIGGSGTAEDPATFAGHLDVKLKPGTAFVLPVAGWAGWAYDPVWGIPDDPPLDPSAFYGTVELDGHPLALGYVAPVYYDPPIPLPDDYYPGMTTIYVQGLVVLHQPLSVGTHTMTLESGMSFPDPDYSYGAKYLNSWTITVEP